MGFFLDSRVRRGYPHGAAIPVMVNPSDESNKTTFGYMDRF